MASESNPVFFSLVVLYNTLYVYLLEPSRCPIPWMGWGGVVGARVKVALHFCSIRNAGRRFLSGWSGLPWSALPAIAATVMRALIKQSTTEYWNLMPLLKTGTRIFFPRSSMSMCVTWSRDQTWSPVFVI